MSRHEIVLPPDIIARPFIFIRRPSGIIIECPSNRIFHLQVWPKENSLLLKDDVSEITVSLKRQHSVRVGFDELKRAHYHEAAMAFPGCEFTRDETFGYRVASRGGSQIRLQTFLLQ